MKIFNMTLHILTITALIITGVIWLGWGMVETIVGLFKKDLLGVGLESLLCAGLSAVTAFATLSFSITGRYLSQLDLRRWKRRELIMFFGAASVFVLEFMVLLSVCGFDLSEMFEDNFAPLSAVWIAGTVLNAAAGVITVKKY